MDLKIRDDDLKKIENEMVEEFCNRKTASMVRKSPEEIIHMWLDWQYARFKVREDSDMGIYSLFDFETHQTLAIVDQSVPGAYQWIYKLCDDLNNRKEDDFDCQDFVNFIDATNRVKERDSYQ